MITAFTLWENLIGEVNTHQGGHIKPNRNFIQWVNTISKDIFNDLYAEYEKTRIMSNMLTPFLRTKNVIVTPVPNQMWDVVVKPADYNYFASARRLTRDGKSCGCSIYETIDGRTGKESECDLYLDEDDLKALQDQADANLCEVVIDKIKNNQWAAVCGHRTLGPTIKNPKCTDFEGGLKLAPKNMGVIIWDYFRKPLEATFLYTIINPGAEDEYIQFNTASQALEWDDKMIPEFIARLKDKYGVFVREPQISQDGKANSKV